MSERKALFLLAAALLLTTSASAAEVKVAGLQAEDVQTEMTEQGVRFQTSYLDKTVPYKDVFIPESYQDDLNGFSVSYKNTSGVTKFSIDFSFNTVKNSSDLPRVLDGYQYQADLMSSQGVTKWSIQSSMDITDNGSGTSLEEDADYDMTLSNGMESANIDGSLNRKVDGLQVLNDAGLNFNASADTFVFDTGLIKPRVSAHYEHLVINYDTRSSVSPRYGKTYDQEENVYSGPDPELIPVSGQINKYDGLNTPSNDYIDRFLMRYDRRYEENPHNITVVIAHPEDEKLLSVDFGGNTEKLNDSHYAEVVDTAEQVGKTGTLLNNTSDYSIKAYNTTILGNTTTALQYKIDSLEDGNNNLRMWILGSFAGGSGTSTDPYEIDNCNQLRDMFQNSTSASYELTSDIDCSSLSSYDMGFSGNTFLTFDGNGHSIQDLTIFSYNGGMFGKLWGTVYNFSLINASGDFEQAENTGFISQTVNGVIENVFVSGSYETGVVGGGSNSECGDKSGGAIGRAKDGADIDNVVSKVNVTAKCDSITQVGGFAGMIRGTSTSVTDSFSLGTVSGGQSQGGFAANTYDFSGGSDLYWDTERSGESSSAVGTGLSTSQMTGTSASSNMDFDFSNTWCTRENDYPGLDVLGQCNSPPVLDYVNSPSDSTKVDSQSPVLSVNISDPDGDTLTVEYFLNGSKIGEETGVSSGSTSTFEVSGLDWGTQYNWNVVVLDDSGASVSSSTYSFTTQKQPQITGSEVVVNDGSGSLEFGLDPQGESDIAGFHGLSSASMFTNSTLEKGIGFPFQASVNVSDSKGAYSSSKDVDLARTDTGHRQDTDVSSSLSTQYLNQTYTLSNGASSSINYTVELSIPGTLDSTNEWSGLLSGGGSVTHTVESYGDWIINQSLSTVERGQKKSRDSSITTQYVYNLTRLKADLETIDVPLSNVDLSSTCSIDTTGDISPTDNLLTEECRNKTFGVGHVTESLTEVRPVNDTVRIGSAIEATRTAQVNNTAGLDFQNLSTTTAFNQQACSQENRSVVDLPAEAEKDFTVDYSCSTGTVYGQDYEVLLNTPSSYYDTVKLNFNIEVPSNVTEESTLKVKLDKDNAPEWDNRESSSVDINASGSGLNINETEESIFVIVPDDYGNSSLHEGTYNGLLKYKYRTSSEGGGTDGGSGGSGGSGPVPPPKPKNNNTVKASFDTQQYYEVGYGGSQVKYLTVYNFDKEPNRVTVATQNSTACSFVDVKSAVNVQQPYRSNVTTLVPSKTQGTYKQSSSILLKARFKIPSKEKLRDLGLDGKFTCKFDTEASQGDAGPLSVTVKPVQRFDPVKELMKLVPQLPDQLVKSEKVCLSSSLSSAYSYQDSGECKGQVEQVPVPTRDSAGLLGTAVFGFLLIAWIRKR
jgi:hypothetical protein